MFSSKPHVAVITRGLFFSIRYSILLYNFPYNREVGYYYYQNCHNEALV